MPDGPVVWGRQVPARAPGVFVVELGEPLPRAPIELTRVGKWVERVPSLTLDGVRPGSRAVATRLGQFWLPSQVVLYIAATTSIGRRIAALQNTVLGDRRPTSGGHWLHTFRASVPMRVWWAATDAAEEYEDALLNAFAASVPADEVAALHDPSVVLPFANLRRPTGERRASGLAGSLLPDVQEPPPPPTHVVVAARWRCRRSAWRTARAEATVQGWRREGRGDGERGFVDSGARPDRRALRRTRD